MKSEIQRFVVGKGEVAKIVLPGSGEYRVTLAGEGAEATILGGWRVDGVQSLNVCLTIVHASPRTSAKTLLKAVLSDKATATISGKIIVEQIAQQTESFLKEAVLLTSSKAKAVAIPDLEILANDVKCSHAAAVSPVNLEQLYYLTSRGISRKLATQLIVEGFLAEVLDLVSGSVE